MMHEDRVRQFTSDAAAKVRVAVKGPQRERGLWSFLTWSFFLSQLAVGNAFAAGAAHAGSGADLNASGGAASPGTSGANALATPDLRALGLNEPQSAQAPGAGAQGQSEAASAGAKIGGLGQLDMTSDAGLAVQAAALGSSAWEDALPVAESHDDGMGDLPPGMAPETELPPIGELPPVIGLAPILDGVLPPILETVDNLAEGLGSTLDGLLVPVVETVEDFASILGPTLDQALAPVETIVDGLVGGLQPVLDPVLAPVAGLAEGVGGLLEPVGGVAGALMELADPILDTVEPLLSPVMNVVDAAQPILDPVLDVAAPIVNLIEPVVEPLLQPLAPVAGPILDVLPLNIGNTGLLSGILDGNGGTDAIASSGTLEFAAHAELAGHELFEAGGYTDFGLALHETPSDAGSGAGDLLGNIAGPINVLLGDADDAGNGLPALLGSLQQEVALRGLGEGLI
jgi:hypothetical protein